jgi:cation diffusion facilitator CzcD-associated flavoprotein CzcO
VPAPDHSEAAARPRVCVVGAGGSGLAATKNLRAHGFEVDCFEREDDLGGNWNAAGVNARVYASTHVISSKPFTQYPDFPMPDSYPDYPHHSQLLEYFRRYADHFGLRRHIRFATAVERVEPAQGARWDVTVRGRDGVAHTSQYAAVVVANGHNWYPKMPHYPGLDTFTGEVLHSAQYKGPDVLRGRRVLVIGAGNTGCDIAVEAAQNAAEVLHSTRRGYWYAPKFVFGRPADQVADFWLGMRAPLKFRQWLFKSTLRATVGDVTRYGLPKPDHEPFETHPIVNSQLVYHVGHGDITPKPDVARFDGAVVHFTDGTSAEPELVILATGYRVRFEFLDQEHLNWTDGRPRLYQHVFTPQHETLFVAGLIQADSGLFTIVHWQTVAIALYLRARRECPDRARALRTRVRSEFGQDFSAGAHYVDSTRHYFEVAHQAYLRRLERTINALEGSRR